jgi:AcrR family transcriptional regulator
MWFMSTSPARRELLERTVDYLTDRGIGDTSLRELATALGTSHRMLIYYFGSKEGLFVEVVRASERRQQAALAEVGASSDQSLEDVTRQFWRRLRSPELAAPERLFFELYGQALQGREYASSVLDGVVDDWVGPAAALLIARGVSPDDARAEARLGLAVVRGLLLDVLATGDVAGVDAAFERYLANLPRLDPAAVDPESR